MKCPSCSKWINPVKTFELALGDNKFSCPNCGSISQRDRVRDGVNVAVSIFVFGFSKLHPVNFTGYLDLSRAILAFAAFILLDNLFGKLVLVYKSPTIERTAE